MPASTRHRLNWPRLVRWLMKMDAHGGLPEWWQWPVPRYGNWGAPGWSAGRWCRDPNLTDWNVEPVDALDALFKPHDRSYQTGQSWLEADTALLKGLCRVRVPGIYGKAYRIGAAIWFSIAACKLTVFGDKRLEISPCGNA